MSWLFSQALAAAYSADTCLDGEPSAPSSGNPTQLAFLPPDRMTAFSRLSRFGMTFKPLMEDRGAALLTSYLAGFPARTSVPPEKAPESTASAAACGNTWQELSVKYCRDSSSWKTHRSLWEEVLPWSSVTLPRWGMTRNGLLFQHPTSERPISANVSGLSPDGIMSFHTQNCGGLDGGSNSRKALKKRSAKVTFPTPNCFYAIPDFGNRKDNNMDTGGRHGVSLRHLVKTFPTPKARDYKDGTCQNMNRDSPDLGKVVGQSKDSGQLNPTWVEWLMGWPLGWTDLKPLATDRFREWQQQHSTSFQETDA
jgi:hypothetical protein